jgi:hypothetical protein
MRTIVIKRRRRSRPVAKPRVRSSAVLAARVREFMEREGVSYRKMEPAFGVSWQTIRNIACQKKRCTLDTLDSVAKGLGFSAGWKAIKPDE